MRSRTARFRAPRWRAARHRAAPAHRPARTPVSERASCSVRAEYSRMRRSSAARDSTERIVQSLLHLDLEPAVDAAVDELQRGQVDDEQRRDHQRAEDAHGARGEARAGHVRAVVADQLPQLARQQHAERDHAAGIEQQDPRLQPLELRRVLHALGEQQERAEADGDPQQHLADHGPARPARRARGYTGSDHVYHSLTRSQSSVQNSSARSDADRWPRRTPARTLML